jgi:hypothetical protein
MGTGSACRPMYVRGSSVDFSTVRTREGSCGESCEPTVVINSDGIEHAERPDDGPVSRSDTPANSRDRPIATVRAPSTGDGRRFLLWELRRLDDDARLMWLWAHPDTDPNSPLWVSAGRYWRCVDVDGTELWRQESTGQIHRPATS